MDIPPPIPPRPPGYEIRTPSGNPSLPVRSVQPEEQQQQQQQQQQYFPLPPQQHQQQYIPSPPQQQRQQQQYFQSPPPQQQQQYFQSPPPQQQQQHFQSSPPPPAPPPQQQQQQQQQSPAAQNGAPPGFPPPAQQPAPPPSQWTEHLFYSNGREAPAFEALMAEFFARLDPQRTGYITPEAYSSFLDVNSFLTEDNVWKKNLKGNLMYKAEDMADFELKAVFEGFYFDHKVVVRNAANRQLPWGGMPLLSLAGFTDIMGVEYAAGPDEHLRGLNNALRHYNVWPEKGPIPRHVLPASTPPELQRRVSEASIRCRTASQTKIDATAAKAAMEARGQQAALDLIGDYRYVRRYY